MLGLPQPAPGNRGFNSAAPSGFGQPSPKQQFMQQWGAKPFGGQQSQYGQQSPQPQGFQQPKTAQPYSAWSQPGMSSLTMAKSPQYGQPQRSPWTQPQYGQPSTPQQGGWWGDAMPVPPQQYGQPLGGQAQSSPFGSWAPRQQALRATPAASPAQASQPYSGLRDASAAGARPPIDARQQPSAPDNPVRLAPVMPNRELEAEREKMDRDLQPYRSRFPGTGDAELRNAMQADRARREQQARDEFTEQYGDGVQRDELRKRRELEDSLQRDRDRFLAMRRRDQELIDAANNGGEQPIWDGNRYVLPSQSRAYSPGGRQRPGGGTAPPQSQFQGQHQPQWGGGMAQPVPQPSFGTPYEYPPGFQQPPQWGAPQGMNRWF